MIPAGRSSLNEVSTLHIMRQMLAILGGLHWTFIRKEVDTVAEVGTKAKTTLFLHLPATDAHVETFPANGQHRARLSNELLSTAGHGLAGH